MGRTTTMVETKRGKTCQNTSRSTLKKLEKAKVNGKKCLLEKLPHTLAHTTIIDQINYMKCRQGGGWRSKRNDSEFAHFTSIVRLCSPAW